MKAYEGKLGRAFLIRIEPGDNPGETIECFAREKGIQAAQVFVIGRDSITGIIAPTSEGNPSLCLPERSTQNVAFWKNCEVVVQEIVGISFRSLLNPASVTTMWAPIASPRTRVMEKPARTPEEDGPGMVPVYLLNAEFN